MQNPLFFIFREKNDIFRASILWADTSIAASLGVPIGGGIGDIVSKKSANDFDTEWVPSIHPFMLGGM